MRWLRQSTAREIAVGPFIDDTDGKTPETALTITQAEVLLKKNEGDWAQKTESTSLVHESNGWYRCLLDTTDTGTLGVLMLGVTEAGALPIWHEFMVVPSNVWDSFFGSDALDVSVIQWLGTAVGAGTAGVPNVDVTRIANAAVSTSTAQLGVNLVNIAGSAVSTSTAQLGTNVVNFGGSAGTFASGRPEVNTSHAAGTAWGSGAITAGSIATGAITSGKFATGAIDAASVADGAIDAGAIATGAITSAKFAAGAVDAAAIADAAIDAATFASGAINAAAIATDAITAAKIAADAIGASELATDAVTEIVNAVLAGIIEGSITLQGAQRLQLAALAGKLSGAATTTVSIRDTGDSKNRIVATVDADGNRSAVTLDAT